ncbi:MAG: ATP-binding cassette domain-containing protein [Cyclobacteriaceae bacterium]|nr:ATP-binding cassette domain-containing protein [Cyclobacteriaceae bacterium]
MSEELLKAIIQLFAIVAKERITDDERTNIKDFLSLHLNQEGTRYYLNLFDEFVKSNRKVAGPGLTNVDDETLQFVDDWAQIMQISKKVNQALTMQQKVVMVIKIIELVFIDGHISERQENLIFYIGEALKIPMKDLQAMRTFVIGQDSDELNSKNILIIDEGSGDIKHAGPRIISKNLTGLIAVLRLTEIETYFVKYLGITSLYINSQPFKSRKVEVFPTGSTFRGSKIDTIYYSDIVGKFLQEEAGTEISFVAEHIFYHFKSGRAGLQNVTVSERGGKLIGLMGGSGSGKSTMLQVLNGSERPSSGRVLINGIDIHENPEQVEGIVGFIPQDDLLMEDLTVFQNLYFAARLCFGHLSIKETEERVEKILHSLGLHEIRDLKVGSPLTKTISGGQRKRVNIGLELLREPTILFVDEPTSGLSSRDSENIMDLLKELSLRGKMIFVVIHQPSSDIYKMFDTLLILDVGGFQIYYGNPVEAVNYFQEIINAATKTPGACPECGNINPEQVFNIIETRVVNEFGRFTSTRKISPGQWYQYFKQRIKIPRIEEARTTMPVTQKIPNWFKQLFVFGKRDLLSKLANKQYLIINLSLSPFLALFMAYFVKYYDFIGVENAKYTFYNNSNIPVYFFMSVVVALFVGLIVSAEEIFRDRKIRKREAFLHLSNSSYLASKIIILFSLSAIQTLTFIVVGNLILEIPLTEIRYWMILFSCSCFSNVLGLNISSAFDSAVTIYILIPVLVIPQLLMSGVVIPFDKFNPSVGKPSAIPVMGEVMASRWAYEAFMVTQFKDNPFEKQFYDLDQQERNAFYKVTFHLDKLDTKISDLYRWRTHWRDKNHEETNNALEVLRYELTEENVPSTTSLTEKLVVGKVDSMALQEARLLINKLSRYYQAERNEALRKKDSIIAVMVDSKEKRAAFDEMRFGFVNKSVEDMVEKRLETGKIVEYDGKLIRKFEPIYLDDHRPANPFDFRAIFFVPTKHFLGKNYDTLYFNIAVIWIMTVILFITLYFDLLKRFVHGLETRRKYRKRNNT